MTLLSRGRNRKEIAILLDCTQRHVGQRCEFVRAKLGAITMEQAMYRWAQPVRKALSGK